MPLIGFVDASHTGRRYLEPGNYPRWYSVEETLERARVAGPRESAWPFELVRAALDAHQDRDYFSTTMFTGACKRGTVVERLCEFILALDDQYAALRGTLLHKVLEDDARAGGVAEVRFFTGVGDDEVSCTPDLLTDDTVWDWKMTENPPTYDYPWPNHCRQLQYNRFIVNNATKWEKDGQPYDLHINPWEWNFEHLVAVYIGPKWPKVLEVTESQQVPNIGDPTRTHAKRMPSVWPDEVVYKKLSTDLEAMNAALRSFPEWPAGLEEYEGWNGPPSFKCPGVPLCFLPNCLAKRWPDQLVWKSPA
jgi:hypothetical protein